MRCFVAAFCALLISFTSRASAQEAIFTPGAKLKVEAEGGVGGEGPAWHPKLGLLTSGNDHINQLDRGGKSRVYRKGAGTNGLLFDAMGRLLACEPVLRRVTRTELDGKITVLTERFEGKRYNQPNDITVDSKGRIYFSDPRYGSREGMEIRDEKGQTIEGVYRIDPDGKVTRVIGREVDRANGVLVSADDRHLYVADNNNDAVGTARKLWRFDLGKDGTIDLASKKLMYDWGTGRGPDGLKQDQKGRLYVAGGLNKPNAAEPATDVKGGIYVLSPAGKLLSFLPVPTDEVTNCAFGGDDLQTLYITGGGTIYSIRTTTPGRVVWPPSQPQVYESGIIWQEPKQVTPGTNGGPPSDAIVLFDGKNMDAWTGGDKWLLEEGVGTAKSSVSTKQAFGDCQLHVEFASPVPAKGKGQGRGNNGIGFMGARYEVQVLDSWDNPTYLDGMCAALYKQRPPLVAASRKPGEWQTYDIIFEAPRFKDKKLVRPGYVTVLHNGVLVHNHVEIQGETAYDHSPKYNAHAEKLPLVLMYHGDPVRFRNIWIREIRELEGKAPEAKDK